MSDASSPIVAWPPLHPIVRRDSFYGWSRTTDPSGYSTEVIVQDLDLPSYSRRFQEEDYWRQLEEHPPQVIVSFLPGTTSYEPLQAVVLEKFLQKHRGEYRLVEQDLLCPVWQRLAQSSEEVREAGAAQPERRANTSSDK